MWNVPTQLVWHASIIIKSAVRHVATVAVNLCNRKVSFMNFFGFPYHKIFFSMARQPYMGLGLLVSSRFHHQTHLRHTTVGRTPLDEGPARRRDLYLTTHNTHKRSTFMPPALDRTATGIGVRTHDPSKRAAEDPRLRPHGHWDRRSNPRS
jgi:hypothetical protein